MNRGRITATRWGSLRDEQCAKTLFLAACATYNRAMQQYFFLCCTE